MIPVFNIFNANALYDKIGYFRGFTIQTSTSVKEKYRNDDKILDNIEVSGDRRFKERIDWAKDEIDRLANVLQKEKLEKIKNDIFQSHERLTKKLDEFKENMKKLNEEKDENLKKNSTMENMFDKYQNELKKLKRLRKEYEETKYKFQFTNSTDEIDKNFIGRIIYSPHNSNEAVTPKHLLSHLQIQPIISIVMPGFQITDVCVLSNNRHVSTLNGIYLSLHDPETMFTLRTIKFDDPDTRLMCLARDDQDHIYVSQLKDGDILEFDSELNFLRNLDGLGDVFPVGLDWREDNLYVCDEHDKRILILKTGDGENLNRNPKSFALLIKPIAIKIFNDNVFVNGLTEMGTYVTHIYNLKDWSLKSKYENGPATFSILGSYLVELSDNNEISFYTSDGDMFLRKQKILSSNYNNRLPKFETRRLVSHFDNGIMNVTIFSSNASFFKFRYSN